MNGVIDSSGIHEINNIGHDLRATVYLNSAAAGRKIEISINGGDDYSEAQLDVDEAGVIGFSIFAPITGLRFTGAEGDEWGYNP